MNFSETKREAARKVCLTHPDKALMVDIVVGDDGLTAYASGCVSCKREGTTPQFAKRPGRVYRGRLITKQEAVEKADGWYWRLFTALLLHPWLAG